MRVNRKTLEAIRSAAADHGLTRILPRDTEAEGQIYPVRRGRRVEWFCQVPHERTDGSRSYWDTGAVPVRAPKEARALLQALKGRKG